MLAQQLPLLDREKRHGKSPLPQLRVRGEHQCVKLCHEPEEPLGRFQTVDVPVPKTQKTSPKNINSLSRGQKENYGLFLPKLTDLNQQSQNLLPQLEIRTKRMKAPLLPKLPGLTVNARPNAYKYENDVMTNEDTENDVISQAMLESQLGALTKSRDTSPSPRSRERN